MILNRKKNLILNTKLAIKYLLYIDTYKFV